MKSKITAIIPARYASTRLPNKILSDIGGKSMIRRVYENMVALNVFDQVILAVDNPMVLEHVESWGGKAVLTREDHISGTDRIAEVAKDIEADYVINIQGDEPMIGTDHILPVLRLIEQADFEIGTAYCTVKDEVEFRNPNAVKVVVGQQNQCLYFSRASIPFNRDNPQDWQEGKRHLGIYLFKKSVLLDVVALPVGKLENIEKLEQLRWLENGYSIKGVAIPGNAISVDTQEDLERVRLALK